MEEIIIMTALSFYIVAVTLVSAYVLKDDMPKILYIIGLVAILPTMVGFFLMVNVQKVVKDEEKREIIELWD